MISKFTDQENIKIERDLKYHFAYYRSMEPESAIDKETQFQYDILSAEMKIVRQLGYSFLTMPLQKFSMPVAYLIIVLLIARFISITVAWVMLFVGVVMLIRYVQREREIKELEKTEFYDNEQLPWSEE